MADGGRSSLLTPHINQNTSIETAPDSIKTSQQSQLGPPPLAGEAGSERDGLSFQFMTRRLYKGGKAWTEPGLNVLRSVYIVSSVGCCRLILSELVSPWLYLFFTSERNQYAPCQVSLSLTALSLAITDFMFHKTSTLNPEHLNQFS